MSGFRFPPPPPPPPRSHDISDEAQSPRVGNPTRGRGNSRGSGNPNYRGRGGHVRHNEHQNQSHHNGSSLNFHTNRQAWSNPTNVPFPRNSSPMQSNLQSQNPQATLLPHGAHINPAFFKGTAETIQAPKRSNVVYQPPNAYSSGSTTTKDGVPLNSLSPPRNAGGHKRKLEALLDQRRDRNQPAPPTAPSVPSFGSPAVQSRTPSGSISVKMELNGEKPKSRSNTLGLTPQDGQQYSSSDNDDDVEIVDEEALYAELGTALTFEHNGIVTNLQSPADLAAWRSERKKNWPTQARWAMKMEQKRRVGEKRKRLIAESIHQLRSSADSNINPPTRDNDLEIVATVPDTKLQRAKHELELQTKRLEELRKKIKASEASLASLQGENATSEMSTDFSPLLIARRERSLGEHSVPSTSESLDGERVPPPSTSHRLNSDKHSADAQETGDDDFNSHLSLTSDSSSISSSDSPSDDESDQNSPPDELPSKLPEIASSPLRPSCKYFTTGRYCRHGQSCKFSHDIQGSSAKIPPKADAAQNQRLQNSEQRSGRMKTDFSPSSARKGIQQRLQDREQTQQDRFVLSIIKYLGDSGFFEEQGG